MTKFESFEWSRAKSLAQGYVKQKYFKDVPEIILESVLQGAMKEARNNVINELLSLNEEIL